MKINKKLYVELLENELIYERTEHRAALADLAIADREIERLGEISQKRSKLKTNTGGT